VVQANLGDEKVDGPILSLGTQSITPNNGKMIICGQFQHVLGVAQNRVARFNTDMTLDTSFNIGSGANGMVSDLIVQGDDKIVLAGNFNSFSGTDAGNLARLTPDGALDDTLSSGTGANARIVSLTPGPGGSGLLISGLFNAYKNNNLYGIAGLDADFNARLDRTGVSNGVGYRAAMVAGEYVVAGSLLLDGVSGGPQGFLARFTNAGSLDNTFGPTAPPTPVPNVNIFECFSAAFPTGPVIDMLLQPDGKIVFPAAFTISTTAPAALLPDPGAPGSPAAASWITPRSLPGAVSPPWPYSPMVRSSLATIG
jgi:hypothetical protein